MALSLRSMIVNEHCLLLQHKCLSWVTENMNKENVVQGAITSSIEVYCDRSWLHTDIFTPYANQQGVGFTRYGADVVAQLGKGRVLMLEVKELEIGTGGARKLRSYDAHQHLEAWTLELADVPIFYGYASVDELSYLDFFRERAWPEKSLFKVHLCRPSELFATPSQQISAEPDESSHSNLLAWILDPPPDSSALANVLTYLQATSSDLRNRLVIIACDKTCGSRILAIPASDLRHFVNEMSRPKSARVRDVLDDLRSEVAVRAKKLQIELQQVHQKVESRLAGQVEKLSDDECKALRAEVAEDVAREMLHDKINKRSADPAASPSGLTHPRKRPKA